MLHLLGVNLPDRKIISVALTSFYGIGATTAVRICDRLLLHRNCRISDLSEAQVNQLSTLLSNMTLESDLKRKIRDNISHHRAIGTYVGKRHAMSLPVRGQNTRNNAKNAKKLNGRRLQKRDFGTLSGMTFPSLSNPSPFERFFATKFF